MKLLNIYTPLLTVINVMMAVLAYSCDKDTKIEPLPEKINRRSVLVYMVAENNLYPFVNGYGSDTGDLTEMLEGSASIPDSCELIVFVDDLKNPRIYIIDNKTTVRKPIELLPELQYDDDGNSASAEVLSQTLTYMYTKHKAKSYGLVLWSHGSGWVESDYGTEVRQRDGKKTAFGIDNLQNTNSNDGPMMEIRDMARVLEQYSNLEFVLFDACFMQSVECLYELRNSADYIIGSPAEIPGLGAPYDKIMGTLFAEPFSPESLAKRYYDYYQYEDKGYQGVLLSAVDTRYLEDFAEATKSAIGNVDLRGGQYVDVLNYFIYDSWRERASSGIPDFYDIKGIMKKNIPEDRYETWVKALDKLTVARLATRTWYSGYYRVYMPVDSAQYSGISMYVPLQKYYNKKEHFTSGYFNSSWYKALNY